MNSSPAIFEEPTPREEDVSNKITISFGTEGIYSNSGCKVILTAVLSTLFSSAREYSSEEYDRRKEIRKE